MDKILCPHCGEEVPFGRFESYMLTLEEVVRRQAKALGDKPIDTPPEPLA